MHEVVSMVDLHGVAYKSGSGALVSALQHQANVMHVNLFISTITFGASFAVCSKSASLTELQPEAKPQQSGNVIAGWDKAN